MIANEPVAVAGAVQILIGSVIALLVAFDVWSPTESQTAAIFGLYAAIVAVITVLVRSRVSPVARSEP